jgi:hypothetical protein
MIAASVPEQVAIAARDALVAVASWVGAITTAGWVVVGLVGIAVIWIAKSVSAGSRLGPLGRRQSTLPLPGGP